MKPENKMLDHLVEAALAIEAGEDQTLGFMARAFVQATLPHRSVEGTTYRRKNGHYSLTISSPDESIGIPYGSIPRLLLAWISTEAVQTQSRDLSLGDSLSGFMRQLGMVPTGGRWGSISRLRTQSRRLFSSHITGHYQATDKTGEHESIVQMSVVDRADLWWSPKDPRQKSLYGSSLRLSEPFYNEVISHPVPYHMNALKALKQSPMALDIYTWATYRNSYSRKPSHIPWAALQMQFGAGYPMNARGRTDFKRKFLLALKKVAVVYPEVLKMQDEGKTLLVRPGRPHVVPQLRSKP